MESANLNFLFFYKFPRNYFKSIFTLTSLDSKGGLPKIIVYSIIPKAQISTEYE